MNVLIRADASSEIGVGHVMRCLTLAHALRQSGAEIVFACRDLPGHFIDGVLDRGYQVITLPSKYYGDVADCDVKLVDWFSDFTALQSRLLNPFDLLIVDHYGLDFRWERRMRAYASRVMVVDDLCNRAHDADFLLDQNLNADELKYSQWVSSECQLLLGPKYALLRPEFIGKSIQIKPKIERILVNFGGADPTCEMLKTMDALNDLGDIHIDFVAGMSNPAFSVLQQRAAEHSSWYVLPHTNDFATLMRSADLFIGAAGSTSWERACLGLPSIVVAVAGNQVDLAKEIGIAGIAIYLGYFEDVTSDDLENAVICVMKNMYLRQSMSNSSIKLVDGLGSIRVLESLKKDMRQSNDKIDVLCSDPDHPIRLRLSEWCRDNSANLLINSNGLLGGEFLFLVSCHQIIPFEIICKYKFVLVLHASDLPNGRGMSPHVWQLLEGNNRIALSLINAAEPFDTGDIWHKVLIEFESHEVFDEINEKLFSAEIDLMNWALNHCHDSKPFPQEGCPTYYRRRFPEDSRLDPTRSIASQFDLMRVSDPIRYPVFFNWHGYDYVLHLTKRKKFND